MRLRIFNVKVLEKELEDVRRELVNLKKVSSITRFEHPAQIVKGKPGAKAIRQYDAGKWVVETKEPTSTKVMRKQRWIQIWWDDVVLYHKFISAFHLIMYTSRDLSIYGKSRPNSCRFLPEPCRRYHQNDYLCPRSQLAVPETSVSQYGGIGWCNTNFMVFCARNQSPMKEIYFSAQYAMCSDYLNIISSYCAVNTCIPQRCSTLILVCTIIVHIHSRFSPPISSLWASEIYSNMILHALPRWKIE